jgi:nicotinate-nucleotide adenylyltransferase
MEFLHRAGRSPGRLGVLPGTFNPVTVAHLALAEAALSEVDEVLFVLPRIFPHKDYSGSSFDDRAAMLLAALGGRKAFSLGATERGLFVEIAEECRGAYGDGVRLSFLCGRDAAERIVGWDYGHAGAIAGMLRQFDLLVAARGGDYEPPADLRWAIRPLPVATKYQEISATEVRGRIARGEPWEHLVPSAAHGRVREIYGPTAIG